MIYTPFVFMLLFGLFAARRVTVSLIRVAKLNSNLDEVLKKEGRSAFDWADVSFRAKYWIDSKCILDGNDSEAVYRAKDALIQNRKQTKLQMKQDFAMIVGAFMITVILSICESLIRGIK
jgi:hypothetical protein